MKSEYLNLTALQDMADGDIDYECEIIQDILTEGETAFDEMFVRQEQQDGTGIGDLVHKFKGCIAYVCTDSVIAEYQRIEDLGRKHTSVPTKQDIEGLQNLFLKVKELLEKYVKEVS